MEKTMGLKENEALDANVVQNWNVSDVCAWLRRINVPEAQKYFRQNNIDGLELVNMNGTSVQLVFMIDELQKKKQDFLKYYLEQFDEQLRNRCSTFSASNTFLPAKTCYEERSNNIGSDSNDDEFENDFTDDDEEIYLNCPTNTSVVGGLPILLSRGRIQHRSSSTAEKHQCREDLNNVEKRMQSHAATSAADTPQGSDEDNYLAPNELLQPEQIRALSSRAAPARPGQHQAAPSPPLEKTRKLKPQGHLERPSKSRDEFLQSFSARGQPTCDGGPPLKPPSQPGIDIFEQRNDSSNKKNSISFSPDCFPKESVLLPARPTNRFNVTPKPPEVKQNYEKQAPTPVKVPGYRPIPPMPPSHQVAETSQGTLQQQQWFFGKLPREVANKRVSDVRRNGTFLVRVSEKGGLGVPYTLCVTFGGEVFNIQIRHRADQLFALGVPKADEYCFSSVMELIDFYRIQPIEVMTTGEPIMVQLRVSPAK